MDRGTQGQTLSFPGVSPHGPGVHGGPPDSSMAGQGREHDEAVISGQSSKEPPPQGVGAHVPSPGRLAREVPWGTVCRASQ